MALVSMLQLFARCLEAQHRKVAAKVAGAGGLDALDQSLVHEIALGFFEADARAAIEELLELQEVFVRDGRGF